MCWSSRLCLVITVVSFGAYVGRLRVGAGFGADTPRDSRLKGWGPEACNLGLG